MARAFAFFPTDERPAPEGAPVRVMFRVEGPDGSIGEGARTLLPGESYLDRDYADWAAVARTTGQVELPSE